MQFDYPVLVFSLALMAFYTAIFLKVGILTVPYGVAYIVLMAPSILGLSHLSTKKEAEPDA